LRIRSTRDPGFGLAPAFVIQQLPHHVGVFAALRGRQGRRTSPSTSGQFQSSAEGARRPRRAVAQGKAVRQQIATLGSNLSWLAANHDPADPVSHIHLEYLPDYPGGYYIGSESLPLVAQFVSAI
jgi:hypothetical protein